MVNLGPVYSAQVFTSNANTLLWFGRFFFYVTTACRRLQICKHLRMGSREKSVDKATFLLTGVNWQSGVTENAVVLWLTSSLCVMFSVK